MDEHIPPLPDAEGPVCRLAFHRGVVPEVVVDHPAGCGEVEAQSPGLQAHQEHSGEGVVLEAVDYRGSLLLPQAAVVDQGRLPQFCRDDAGEAVEGLDILAEDENLFSPRQDSLKEGKEESGLAGEGGGGGA